MEREIKFRAWMEKEQFVKILLELWNEYADKTGKSNGQERIVEDTLVPFMRWLSGENNRKITPPIE